MNSSFFDYRYITKKQADYLTNISQKHQFTYFEIPKTGCSTIKKTLQTIENEGIETPKELVHDKSSSPLKGFLDLDLKQKTLEKLFSFTIVRNPYDRILSTYLDKIVTNLWEKKRRVGSLGFKFEEDISFLNFLKAIEKQDPLDMDIHWKPQSYLLPKDLSIFNYIGKFETFENDWNIILNKIKNTSLNTNEKIFQSRDVIFHKTNANEKKISYYGKEEIA